MKKFHLTHKVNWRLNCHCYENGIPVTHNKGIFDDMGIQLLGVNRNSIKKAEDREEFKKLILEINELPVRV